MHALPLQVLSARQACQDDPSRHYQQVTLKLCGAASMDALDSTTTMLRLPCLQALLASTRGSLHAHQSDHSADNHET